MPLTSQNKIIWYILFITCSLSAIFLSYQLKLLPFWGSRPLWLFLSLFGGGISVWVSFGKPIHSEHRIYLISALVTGLLLGGAFCTPALTPLVFVAWVPVMVVFFHGEIQTRYSTTANRTGRDLDANQNVALSNLNPKKNIFQKIKVLYLGILLWNILTTWWVANASLGAGIFAIVVNSMLMCLPFVFALWTQRILITPFWTLLAWIAYWCTFEHIHMNWDLSWPWLTLGNYFSQLPSWVQWFDITGVGGGTIWVLVVNAGIAWFWMQQRSFNQKIIYSILFTICIIGGGIGVSHWRKFQLPSGGMQVPVTCIQPNYDPHYEKFQIPEHEQAIHVLELMKQHSDSNLNRLILLPETTFGLYDLNHMEHESGEVVIHRQLLEESGSGILYGLDAYQQLYPPIPDRSSIRKQFRSGSNEPQYFEVLNTAVMDTGGARKQLYFKSKLVPGAEIYPFRSILSVFEPIVRNLGGTLEGVGTQNERGVLEWKQVKAAPIICYESVYGEFVTGYVRNGANLLCIITNDGWWDNSPGHRQHLRIGALRAIETRRYIARAANTGISCMIDPWGGIHSRTSYGTSAAIDIQPKLLYGQTFYVRNGDWVNQIMYTLAALFLAWGLLRSLKTN